MRFARISEHHLKLFRRSGCNSHAFHIYVVLIMHQNTPGDQVWPSIARMAELTGLPRRTVERHLGWLREAGLITAKRTRGPAIYTLRYAGSGAPTADDTPSTAHHNGRYATDGVPDTPPSVGRDATGGGSHTPPTAHGSREGREKEERSESTAPLPGLPEGEGPESVGNILAQAEIFQEHEPHLSPEEAKQLAIADAQRKQSDFLKARKKREAEAKEEARLAAMRKTDPEKFATLMKDRLKTIGKIS